MVGISFSNLFLILVLFVDPLIFTTIQYPDSYFFFCFVTHLVGLFLECFSSPDQNLGLLRNWLHSLHILLDSFPPSFLPPVMELWFS